jgi:hypothetical protein
VVSGGVTVQALATNSTTLAQTEADKRSKVG